MYGDFAMGNVADELAVQGEAALAADLRAGSEEAFACLIERYHKPIYSLLARTVHDRADAADLTQEVFLKVFRGVRSFRGSSSLRTWIYRIALREAANSHRWWVRHRQKEVPIEQEILGRDSSSPVRLKDTLEDRTETPYESVVRLENRERVEAALRKVPEPFRSTLILRDVEGLVYEEVADIQGVNLGTVKSRLVRGRAYLKAALMAPAAGEAEAENSPFEIPLGGEAR